MRTTLPPARRWISLPDAAEHLAVSEKAVRRMISRGTVHGYRLGRNMIRLDINELDATLRPIPTAGAGDVT